MTVRPFFDLNSITCLGDKNCSMYPRKFSGPWRLRQTYADILGKKNCLDKSDWSTSFTSKAYQYKVCYEVPPVRLVLILL